MLNSEQLQTIEKETRFLLEKLGEQGEITVKQTQESDEQAMVQVFVKVAEPKMLIGEKGQTLFELQHILRLMLRRKIEEPFYLSLDVNEYKQNKEEYLNDVAQGAADEVALLKKPKELTPMSSAERRIVHVALAKRSDVVSESVGEGSDRRVVIRLKA